MQVAKGRTESRATNRTESVHSSREERATHPEKYLQSSREAGPFKGFEAVRGLSL